MKMVCVLTCHADGGIHSLFTSYPISICEDCYDNWASVEDGIYYLVDVLACKHEKHTT